MVQDAVLASLGYTLMPADIAAPFLEDGQLVNLMPQSSSTCLLRTTRPGIITTQIALRALPRRLLAT